VPPQDCAEHARLPAVNRLKYDIRVTTMRPAKFCKSAAMLFTIEDIARAGLTSALPPSQASMSNIVSRICQRRFRKGLGHWHPATKELLQFAMLDPTTPEQT
jgi:hypothetical protein